ncbi:MAG TPA: hypothetical protein DCF68_15325, partial [Cyanothece sp. UBA12306]|nr:hypothetical protein [Cyanothece sp. UBA12306]
LFAWRYGYIRESGNPLKKSITELEYRKAQELEKPCFIFLLNEEAPWPRKQMDAVTGDGQRGVLIDQLRQELGQTKLVSFFKTPDELASLVSAAISNWEKEELKERSLQNEIKKATSSDYRTEETESKEESRKIVAANPIEEQIYQNSPYSLGKTMTSIERRHLEQQLKEQTEEYEAKTKELEFLRKAAQTADLRPKEAFKLSEQIEELELKRQEISQKLAKIAEKLDN